MSQDSIKKKLRVESSWLCISDLPPELLRHTLSYLPSREVVKTCTLLSNRSWSNLWKFVPALRIAESIVDCDEFIKRFIFARGNDVPIVVCDIKFTDLEHIDLPDVNTWIFQLVSVCKVENFRLIVRFEDDFLWLDNLSLVSKYLRRLELDKVALKSCTVDLSSCPSLEVVNLIFCDIEAKRFISKSIKCLTLDMCEFNGSDERYKGKNVRTQILIPSVVSLKLFNLMGRTPSFDAMPLLEDARVKYIDDDCSDCCKYTMYRGCGNENCIGCFNVNDERNGSILLEGLTAATHLKLINDQPHMFIIEREIRRCPIFRNLKTLILNDWFVADDLHRLICILRCSPVLQKHGLYLYKEPLQLAKTNIGNNKMKHSFVMEHLAEVKINCQKELEWVKTIANSLSCTIGIPPEKIIIEEALEFSLKRRCVISYRLEDDYIFDAGAL